MADPATFAEWIGIAFGSGTASWFAARAQIRRSLRPLVGTNPQPADQTMLEQWEALRKEFAQRQGVLDERQVESEKDRAVLHIEVRKINEDIDIIRREAGTQDKRIEIVERRVGNVERVCKMNHRAADFSLETEG